MRYLSLLLLYCSFFSCTLKKRIYREGYFVNYRASKEGQKSNLNYIPFVEKTSTEKFVNGPVCPAAPIFSAAAGTTDLIELKNYSAPPDSCADMICFRSGKDVQATVLEIKDESIRYKSCEYPFGGIKESSKEKILMVKFANGVVERYETEKFDYDSPKIHPLATLSFVTALAALGFLIFSFVSVLCAILLVASLITSLVSRYVGKEKIMADRQHYRGLKLIKAALVITVIVTLLILAIGASIR